MSLLEAAKALFDARDPLEHERGWEALAAAIAAAESAPAVVTPVEVYSILKRHSDSAGSAQDQPWKLCGAERLDAYQPQAAEFAASEVAALVAERTAAAVEAARAEERERAGRHYVECPCDCGSPPARGQSEAPAPATPAARPGGGGELEEWIALEIEKQTGVVIDGVRVACDQGAAARAIATRLRAREALVAEVVEAAGDALALLRQWVQGEEIAADRLEAALDALGKEGA